MSDSTIRLVNGGVLQVRQGILRGAGPLGPVGPTGAKGATGPTGATGPAGTVGDASSTTVFSGINSFTSAQSPKLVTFDSSSADGSSPNPITLAGNRYDFNVTTTGAYSIILEAVFDSQAGATGHRRVGVYKQGSSTPDFYAEFPALNAASNQTRVILPVTARLLSSQVYQVKVATTGSADSVVAVTMRIARLGIGNLGPTGPQGTQGVAGPTGPTGPQGSAGGGYGTFEAMVTGGGSGTAANDGIVTDDQDIPIPQSTSSPKIPGWFKALAEYLEKRIVARYADAAALDAARPSKAAGEVYFIDADDSLWVQGGSSRFPLAQVRVSASAAPTSGTYPAGTIWVQI